MIPDITMCYVPLCFGNQVVNNLVDLGFTCCIVDADIFQVIIQSDAVRQCTPSSVCAVSTARNVVAFEQEAVVNLKIGHLSWNFKFQVSKDLPVAAIIGAVYLVHTRAVLNMARKTISFPYDTPKIRAG